MIELEYDSFAVDLAIAQATEKLVTGSAITRYFTRHPLACAETATVIDRLAPGRFVIGLGTGPMKRQAQPGRPGFPKQRWGLPDDREVGRLREYIELARLACEPGREERFLDFAGEFYNVEHVKLRLRPDTHIPIWIAAGGDMMLRLAGRAADGVFTFFANEGETHRIKEVIAASAAKAGRRPDAVKLGNTILTCVDEDRDAARHAMRAYLVDYYFHLPGVQDHLEASGYEEMEAIRDLAPIGDTKAGIDIILSDPPRRKAAELISDRLLDDITLAGSPAECRERYNQIIGWGTDLPILYAFPVDGDWLGGYTAVIEAFAFEPAAVNDDATPSIAAR
jgi:alkanesulfonate monooxygenase SsuD/methylene tetrahydromethanopterin reductase-like flavin-dependent oxidoreductase (luciferase family)